MRLKLQNIGIIEEADINIDGITLIAGQNDSGKSTVGKVLYALIKGFNQDANAFHDEKNTRISYNYQDILKELKKAELINVTDFQTKEINAEWIEKIEKVLKSELKQDTKDNVSKHLTYLKSTFKVTFNTIEQKERELENWFLEEIETLHNVFRPFIISPKIEIEDLTGNTIIHQKKPFSDYHYLKLNSDLETYFKEAYYIESPSIIDSSLQQEVGKSNIHFLRNRQNELRIALANSLPNNININFSSVYKEISQIINGEISIDQLDGVNYKKNNKSIDIRNTAVGIKSFGIIQLLLKNNRLNNRSLLIIDEPEVHLHPTWQVKYAEILVFLSKEYDIPIVLTSHSPYFIEALEAYTKKYKYESSTNFYFAEKNEDGLSSKIIDVTKNISPILSSISEAFFTIQDLNYED